MDTTATPFIQRGQLASKRLQRAAFDARRPSFCLTKNLLEDNQKRANINEGKRTQNVCFSKINRWIFNLAYIFEIPKASSIIKM